MEERKWLIIIIGLLLIQNIVFSNNNLDSIDVYLEKAKNFSYRNNDSVLYYGYRALNTAKISNSPEQYLEVLNLIIKSHIKNSNYSMAIKACNTSKKIAVNNKLVAWELNTLINTGNVYQASGFTSEALEIFFKAQQRLEYIDNYKYEADLYYYMASAYDDIDEHSKNIIYSNKSIATANTYGYEIKKIYPYLLLSNTFNQIDSVKKYLNLCSSIIKKKPHLQFEKVVVLNNQALLNKAIGNLNLSKTQYLEAIDISESNGYRDYLSTLYNNYAYLLTIESKYDSANIVLDKALGIAQKLKSSDLQATIYDSYSDYFTAIENFKTALAYQDSSIIKRNQYREQQQIQKSLFLSAVFETEQKEKEILQQENEITQLWVYMLSAIAVLAIAIGLVVYFRQKYSLGRSRMDAMEKSKSLEIADALIHGQDAERKRLAMDLHDGLGARLGVLRFLVDGFFKPHEKYDEISNSIITIQQNVRELSHRMLPTQLKTLGLETTVRNMVSSINKSGKFVVDFETNIKKRLTDKLEVNLYYLIYELTNNATSHSNGNTIFVQLFEHDDVINLSIEDNGSSFKQNDNHDGMGLKNIKTRVEYMGGNFMVEADNSVTIFMIEIPALKL